MKPRAAGPKRYQLDFYLVEVLMSDDTRSIIEIQGNQRLEEKEAKMAVADQMSKLDVVAIWVHKYLLTGHRVSVSEKKIPS
jgi:hypothetical protein